MCYRVVRFSVVVVVCVGVLASWGCPGGPSRVHPPGIDASAAGQKAVEQYDTNGDGLIGGAELDKAPALKFSIVNLDTRPPAGNNDGSVSAEEITARIKKWQDGRLGRMSLMVKVTRGGRPLRGATVKFVPEAFLGDEVQAATGVTDEAGIADLTVPLDPDDPDDVPGVQCGLFRVEITGQGAAEAFPDLLGQEVSMDAAGIQEGIEFRVR